MKTMITIPRNQMSTSSLIHNNVIKGFLHSNSTRKLHTIFRENICNNNSKENVKMQHVSLKVASSVIFTKLIAKTDLIVSSFICKQNTISNVDVYLLCIWGQHSEVGLLVNLKAWPIASPYATLAKQKQSYRIS